MRESTENVSARPHSLIEQTQLKFDSTATPAQVSKTGGCNWHAVDPPKSLMRCLDGSHDRLHAANDRLGIDGGLMVRSVT